MRAARQPLAEVGREGQHVDPGDPGSAPEPEDLPPAQTLIEPLEEGGRVGNPPPSSDHRHPGCTAGARSPGRPRSGSAHPGGGQVAFDLPGQRQAVRRHAAGPHDHQADGARLARDGLAQAAVRAGPDLERLLRRRLEGLLRVVDRPRHAAGHAPSGRSSSTRSWRAAASGRPGSRATATCWSTTRPSTRRRARPSPRSASPPRRGSRPANGRVTFTVSSYDDAGTATPAAGARVRVNGVPHHVNAGGTLTLRFARGTFSVRAVEPGAIRSQKLWVHAS